MIPIQKFREVHESLRNMRLIGDNRSLRKDIGLVDIGHTGKVVFSDYMEWIEDTNPSLLAKTKMKLNFMPSLLSSKRGVHDNNASSEYNSVDRDAKISQWLIKRQQRKAERVKRKQARTMDIERRKCWEIISSTDSSYTSD